MLTPKKEQFLKVIYYVNAGEARQITISRARISLLAFLLFAISTWMVVSVMAVAALANSNKLSLDTFKKAAASAINCK